MNFKNYLKTESIVSFTSSSSKRPKREIPLHVNLIDFASQAKKTRFCYADVNTEFDVTSRQKRYVCIWDSRIFGQASIFCWFNYFSSNESRTKT